MPRAQSRNSVKLESALVIVRERSVLITFLQIKIADCEHVEFGPHEATKGLFRSAHDRFASYIETGIDQYGAAGLAPEGRQQGMEARVGFGVNCLDARGVIDMRHRRNFRTRQVELVDAE